MTRPMARCHLKMSSSSTSPTWTKNCQPHLKTWNSSTNPGTYCDIIICNTYHLNMFYNMFCSLYLYLYRLYLCLCLCLSIYICIYTIYISYIYIMHCIVYVQYIYICYLQPSHPTIPPGSSPTFAWVFRMANEAANRRAVKSVAKHQRFALPMLRMASPRLKISPENGGKSPEFFRWTNGSFSNISHLFLGLRSPEMWRKMVVL